MEDGELATRALQTQEAVHRRAEVELLPAALLVTDASKDTSKSSIKGVSSTSQLVTSTGSNNARAMWKSMITNASFRTKKLPDDITVTQEAETEVGSASAPTSLVPLSSISEEADEPSAKPFRLPELSSLVRKREKSKSTDLTKLKTKPAKKSANGVADLNGSGTSVTDNGSVVHVGSDWNEEEAIEMELRRKSGESNIVPPT
nr:EOG090X02H3 [Cyclestheria hislopi]